MNQQETFEKLEEATKLQIGGLMIIKESLEKIEGDCEDFEELLDEETELLEKGCELHSEIANQVDCTETQHPKNCSCRQC